MPRTSTAAAVAALLLCSTACGGADAPSVDVNEEHCVDDEGHDICAAMAQEQVTVPAVANGSIVQLTTRDGDVLGRLAAGDELLVACSDLDVVNTYGVVPVDADLPDAEEFAVGLIDGENFAGVAYIDERGLEAGPTLYQELEPALDERFEDLGFSCDDGRVVTSRFGRDLLLGE